MNDKTTIELGFHLMKKNYNYADLKYMQKQREDPEIHWQCWDKRRIENMSFKGFSSTPLQL